MTVAIVVAVRSNNVIGLNGKLPWHIPDDLKKFRELTEGHAVIMGRKTYESLPEKSKPLPKRLNVVVSRTMSSVPGVLVCRTLEQAIATAIESTPPGRQVFVIGGEEIYGQAISLADEIYLTRVEDSFSGDSRFPLIPKDQWRVRTESKLFFQNDCEYRFIEYERIRQ